MADENNNNKNDQLARIKNGMIDLATPEGFQRFFLGTKKNGKMRAVYDVVKDYTVPPKPEKKKKHKKKHKKHSGDTSTYNIYPYIKKAKKHKKKHKKNSSKFWHI